MSAVRLPHLPLPPTWALFCRLNDLRAGRIVFDWERDG